MVGKAMRGKVIETDYREASGRYQQKFYPDEPAQEALEEAKKGLLSGHNNDSYPYHFNCAACEQTWVIGSDAAHIKETGICRFCLRAIENKSYVVWNRSPTLEEVLKQWDKCGRITDSEAAVLVREIRSRK